MPVDQKVITAAQRKAVEKLYQSHFDAALKAGIVKAAQADAARVVRDLVRTPGYKKKLHSKARKWVTENLDSIVTAAMKDSYLTW